MLDFIVPVSPRQMGVQGNRVQLRPSSAAVAVALSLPLWGILVCGGLVVGALLETAWEAAKGHGQRAEEARLAERPPGS